MNDPRRLEISGQNFQQLISGVVEKGASVTFKVTGKSMFPNIISNDILTLAPYQDRMPQVGDVVGVANPVTHQVIVHRIINKKKGLFLIKGDNILKSDGLFMKKSIIGYVCRIRRNNSNIAITKLKNKKNAFLSRIRFFCLSKPLFYFNIIKY